MQQITKVKLNVTNTKVLVSDSFKMKAIQHITGNTCWLTVPNLDFGYDNEVVLCCIVLLPFRTNLICVQLVVKRTLALEM